MILKNMAFLMLPVCLALPVPACAMIELLPVFFAGTGIAVMGATVLSGALLKRFVMGYLFRQEVVVSWKALYMVSLVEAAIMACSFLLSLAGMGSGGAPHGKVAIVLSTIFACATVLYSVVAIMPNLWLLKRTQIRHNGNSEPHDHTLTAWLLSLPTPFVLVLWVIALCAVAR